MQLSIKDIKLSLKGNIILDGVSFSIEDKQFVSILGESGAGKSTALKIISGILPADSGQVFFDDECVDDIPTFKRDISMLFQDIRLFPNMTVGENVSFPLKVRKVAKAQRIKIVEDMLDAVQLSGFAKRKTHELSGGQQQRIALARALAAHPRALLLDEPFSGLDEQLRDEMRALVAELHNKFGMTSLMVTHDGDEALVMSDVIIYMDKGKILQIGSPADILLSPENDIVRASFNTSSAIEGVVSDGMFTCGKLRLAAPETQSGPAVLVRTPTRSPFVHSLSM